MSATKIAAAFERWHEIWTTTYATDKASNAAAEERHALAVSIMGMRAVCLPDVLPRSAYFARWKRAANGLPRTRCWRASPLILSIWRREARHERRHHRR
jgi:predicted oxidoreductase